MSLLRRVDVRDPFFCRPSSFVAEAAVFAPGAFAFSPFLEDPEDICLALDLLSPNPTPAPTPFDLLDTVEDLVRIERTPRSASYRRVLQRVRPEPHYLQPLCDRVSALESRFDRLVSAAASADRKYTWTAEIEGEEADRKYKWTAEIKSGKKEKEKEKQKEKEKHHHHQLHHHLPHHRGGAKSYKWTAEIKEKGEEGCTRTYTWKSSTGGGHDSEGKSHKEKKEKKKDKEKKKEDKCATRVVEIEEPSRHGAVVLRQAFAKRTETIRRVRGKKKELSPLDAAVMIQMSFRAYLIRRSQALRALRELAVAKSKLKEIRGLFHNFSYRRRVAHDAEERQRFAEKIIVLLLTVDAIEGADVMVRTAKKSMIDKLEAMLDVVDPQPPPPPPPPPQYRAEEEQSRLEGMYTAMGVGFGVGLGLGLGLGLGVGRARPDFSDSSEDENDEYADEDEDEDEDIDYDEDEDEDEDEDIDYDEDEDEDGIVVEAEEIVDDGPAEEESDYED